MKNVLFIITLCILTSFSLTAQRLDKKANLKWESTYKKALRKSKKEKKPVLIYFTGSDWCGPCKVLDKKLFHSERFEKIAKKDLILYKSDSPRNKDLIDKSKLEVNNKLKKKFKIKSFPTIVFVNHKEKKLGVKKGLIITEYYYPFIDSMIKKY